MGSLQEASPTDSPVVQVECQIQIFVDEKIFFIFKETFNILRAPPPLNSFEVHGINLKPHSDCIYFSTGGWVTKNADCVGRWFVLLIHFEIMQHPSFSIPNVIDSPAQMLLGY